MCAVCVERRGRWDAVNTISTCIYIHVHVIDQDFLVPANFHGARVCSKHTVAFYLEESGNDICESTLVTVVKCGRETAALQAINGACNTNEHMYVSGDRKGSIDIIISVLFTDLTDKKITHMTLCAY